MGSSVIVSGARTPMGRLLGALKNLPATELGGSAIAGALAAILDDDDLADRLRAAGRDRAAATTWTATAAATVAAYQEVLGT